VWGLGIGCRGVIQILIEPLSENDDHPQITQITQILSQKKSIPWLLPEREICVIGVIGGLYFWNPDVYVDNNSTASLTVTSLL
jgi:hypothetical protein